MTRDLRSPKRNSKFEILLVKIFRNKKKKQIHPSTIENINFFLLKKVACMVSLDKGLQKGNVKQEPFRQI